MICFLSILWMSFIHFHSFAFEEALFNSNENEGRIFRISIPGVSESYNSSILKYPLHTGKPSYLLAFRYDLNRFTHQQSANIGLVVLDDEFKAKSPISRFYARENKLEIPHQTEDPRLFYFKKKIYLIFSDADQGYFMGERRLHIVQVCPSKRNPLRFRFKNIKKLIYRHSPMIEKNWTPYEGEDGNLYVVYSFEPYKILRIDLTVPSGEENAFEIQKPSEHYFGWLWGQIRGGSPAVVDPIDPESLVTVFHSAELTGGVKFFMGLLKFEKKAPHRIIDISFKPLHHPQFYQNPHPVLPTCKIVYPCGLVIERDHFIISYGNNDHETYIYKVPRTEVEEGIPVFPKEK